MNKQRKIALKEKFRTVRVKGSVFLLGGLLALAVVMSLGRKASGKDGEAEKAFDAWAKENVEVKVKSRKFVRVNDFPGYGKLKCPNFPEMIEFALLMDDMTDFLKRSQERRRWAYNHECKLLNELLARPFKSSVDSILIGRTMLRTDWYGRLQAPDIPETTRVAVLETARAAHERVDSVERISGLRLEYDVNLAGKPVRMYFVSPRGGLDLELEDIKFLRK